MKAENPVHDRKRECINYEHVFITERKKTYSNLSH